MSWWRDPTSRRGFLRGTIVGAAFLAAGATVSLGLRRFGAPRVSAPPADGPVPGDTGGPVTHRWTRALTLPLERPRAIARDEQACLYVVGDQALLRLDEAGRVQQSFALDAPPSCVDVRADGGQLALGLPGRVEVWDLTHAHPQATRRTFPIPGAGSVLTSLALGPGCVHVADAGRRRVDGFDLATGQALPSLDDGLGFDVPSPYFDVARAADGGLWVADPGRHQLRRYDLHGRRVAAWGRFGAAVDRFCGCCNPSYFTLCIGPNGQPRFITSEKGIPRVKWFDAEGRFGGLIAGSEQFPPLARGLDVVADRDGRVFVLDPATRLIHLYEPNPA